MSIGMDECATVVSTINEIIINPSIIGATKESVVDVVVLALAFKYWHENYSLQLNSRLTEFENLSEYIRTQWRQFSEADIGDMKVLARDWCDYDLLAKFLKKISVITRHVLDANNVRMIEDLCEIVNECLGCHWKDRFIALRTLYSRYSNP